MIRLADVRFAAVGVAVTLSALMLLSACTGSRQGLFGGGRGGPTIGTAPVTGEVIGSGPVKIALLLPLSATGNVGQIAPHLRNAAELAIRDFQTANIQILVKDDRGTPEGARAAATQAIAEGAELILGPVNGDAVKGAATIAKGARVPVIAFSTNTAVASTGVYLLSFLAKSDVERIISFAAAKGKRSFAALLPTSNEGTLLEAALQSAVANSGGRVMAIERYEFDKASMQQKATAIATLANQGTVDAVFIPGGSDQAPFLAQVLAASGVLSSKVALLGSGQWDGEAGIAAESNLNGAWYPAPDNSGFASFAQRYQAAYASAPFRTATLAYDAVSLAAGLAARFGDERFADRTLTNASGFIGVDGAFRLLTNGLNQRGLAVYQINRGKVEIIDAAPRTFAGASG